MNAPLPRHLLSQLADLSGEGDQQDEFDAHHRTAALLWPEVQEIALCVLGLEAGERAMLEKIVQFSQRRGPKLRLLPPGKAYLADVIMIDSADAQARAWSDAQDWLDRRAVIWINGQAERPGHTLLHRPIQWPVLPLVLARSLRSVQAPTSALALRTRQADGPMVMVVAEEPDARRRLRAKLEAAGCRVTGVRTAREGLAALHAASYACVVLAGEVPDADGAEVCRRLRGLERRIGRVPVLMLNDSAGPLARWRAKWAGCDDVVAEPARGKDLRRLMHRLSERSMPAARAGRAAALN
jgi:CheY-like chemotaxis protein